MANINASFDPDVQVNVYLESQTNTLDALQRPLILVDQATNTLNGNRTQRYATLAEAKVALSAGYISAGTYAAINVVFSQTNVPVVGVLVGRCNVGTESYSAALLACIAADPAFYGVYIASRTSSDIEAVSATIETCGDKTTADDAGYPFKHMLSLNQSADTTLLTGAYPSALADLEGRERTLLCFHPTATAWFDVAHQGRLSVDLATIVPPWNKWTVKAVSAYPAGTITADQLDAAQTINVDMLALYGANLVASPGQSQAGRQMQNIVVADWLAAAIQDAIIQQQVDLADANLGIPLNAYGQQVVVALIQGVLQTGIAAGGLQAVDADGNPAFSVTALPITPADKAAFRMRFDVTATLTINANKIVVNVYTNT